MLVRSGTGLERSLELAAGRELRHDRRGDLDALPGARVDALARRAAENLPKPVKFTESLPFSVSVIVSRNASTALPASRAERPLFWATWLMKSCLVKKRILLRRVLGFRPWLKP